jgi:two-component system, NtrC family, response regulator PilR
LETVKNTPINNALIVDDEPDLCQLAEITLNRMGLNTESANTLADAKRLLESSNFDLCLTDMNLPDGNGIELVSYIQQNFPNLPVAVITAYGNMESAVKALKAGAFDFVSKPIDIKVLRGLVEAAMKLPELISEARINTSNRYNLLGDSQAIEDLRKSISKFARSQAPVFIHGESGCGKELAAHLIHQQSARADQPFIPVNCGAIPGELMESEFFGHKKGSFTGAIADKAGLFQAANGGTLFLDEVADLPLQMQVKLLRAIQEKAVRPIGESNELTVDVRILSASHKNLIEKVGHGQFREDLFYRINVIQLDIPNLRNRPEDIPILANYLLSRLTERSHEKSKPEFTTEALQALMRYEFPGNVRELENILERALALAEDNEIKLQDLQLPNRQTKPTAPPTKQDNTSSLILAANEEENILKALEQTRWNKTAAAKLLGLTLRQLRYRLEKLNI